MSRSFKITYTLRSSSHVGIVPIEARTIKCRDARVLIAERLSTQEEDLCLYYSTNTANPIHLDEDINAFAMLEVARGMLNVTNSANRTLTATQQKQRKDAREIKAVVGVSGTVTLLQRGPPTASSGHSNNDGYIAGVTTTGPVVTVAATSEEERMRQMQSQISLETGMDSFRRMPMRPGGATGGAGGGAGGGPSGATTVDAAGNVVFREPPKGYICHNCGKGGHHINHCPEARNGFNKVKVLQAPIGIPESMLERCDPNDPRAKFVTRDGVTVVRKQVANAFEQVNLVSSSSKADAVDGREIPTELQCAVCKTLAKNAVVAPCCEATCCESCLLDEEAALHADGAPVCPLCKELLMIDEIDGNAEVRANVEAFLKKRPREE